MGWFDRILSVIGFDVETVEEEVAASKDVTSAEERAPRHRQRARFSTTQATSAPLVALPSKSAEVLQVVIFTPRDFNDVQQVADHLKARRPVILTLDVVERDLAQRMTNFLSGTIYALSGEMFEVAPSVIFFAPGSIGVQVEGRVARRSSGRQPKE